MIFIETRNSLKIGFALTGSFCTFSAVLPQIEKITAAGIEIVPIMSEKAYSTDTRFGTSAEFISKIEKITGNKVLHRQTEVEPIGPKKMIDALVIAPCSGTTAAKIANAHYFISHLPQGYNTMLYSDGANLSQGQRQLVAIARAAVSEAPVLILDEATSSVDTRTEKLIEKGLDGLMAGRTVFVIAHRLSTVRNANAILVLEQGRVIERGSHADLLEQHGKYYQLYTNMIELA